jgi:ribosome-binding protein aMBF1 (putative translation factor)
MKREVYACDHCQKDIDGQKYAVTAFGSERHLCPACASDLEYWIKPSMAKLHDKTAEIVLKDIE